MRLADLHHSAHESPSSGTPERFLQQAVVPSVNTSTVEYRVCVCVCVCADGVIEKLFHLHGNASLPVLPPSLPRSGLRLPSLGPVVKVTQHAPGWRADRQAGRE